MGTKHRHYDVIVAWAAGEEIEIKGDDGVWVSFTNAKHVIFYEDMEYRIKPKRVRKEGWVNVYPDEYEGRTTEFHFNKDRADRFATAARVARVARVACVHITWEEEA